MKLAVGDLRLFERLSELEKTIPYAKAAIWLRSMVLFFCAGAVTGFFSSCVIIFDLILPDEDRVHRIAYLWTRNLVNLFGAKIEVIGQENITPNTPVIFMSNHLGLFDILVIYQAVPVQFRWIIKKELFKIPLFGRALKNAGYLKIDRKNREVAIHDVELAASRIRAGACIMTFPEGTRSKDGKIGTFKQGMFHLVLQTGVPIVPISIAGAFEILNTLTSGVGTGKKVVVIIGSPIETREFSPDKKEELLQKVRAVIIANYEKGANLL